jgi:hypothetical protein
MSDDATMTAARMIGGFRANGLKPARFLIGRVAYDRIREENSYRVPPRTLAGLLAGEPDEVIHFWPEWPGPDRDAGTFLGVRCHTHHDPERLELVAEGL